MERKGQYSQKVYKAIKVVCEHIVLDIGPKGRGSPPLWPISIVEVNWYLSQFMPREVYFLIKKLKEKGLSTKGIAKLFWGPSGFIHLLYCADFTFEGLTSEQSAEFVENVVDLISCYRKKDLFCENWKNILWSKEKVKSMISKYDFIETKNNGDISKTLAKLNTVLWQYCILIQIGHRAYSHEFHGPYNLENGEILLVREYYNLKPVQVWPFTNKLPVEKLTSFEVYKDIDIRLDMFNHLDTSALLPQKLQRFCIIMGDSKVVKRGEINQAFDSAINTLEIGNTFIKGFTKRDWVKKLIEMRCFWLKNKAFVGGVDWKPDAEILALPNRLPEAEKATQQYMQSMRNRVVGAEPKQAVDRITQLFLNRVYKKE